MDVSLQRTLALKVFGVVYYVVSLGTMNPPSMNTVSSDIDFVIPWVDGEDHYGQALYGPYATQEDKSYNQSGVRYRNWGLLRDRFKSVELSASWERTVHFVICG